MGEFKRDFKMKVKILFLDIDGVLNSKLYYKYIYKPENGWSRFDPYCVVLIKRLIEETSWYSDISNLIILSAEP